MMPQAQPTERKCLETVRSAPGVASSDHSDRGGAMHYVIVGNGVAGMEAALALRGRDADARISVVSAEHDHFFSRPALMYVFAGQLRLQDTEPYDRQLYERMRFERVSKRVKAVEPAGRSLVFEDGSRLGYDALLFLAVGSRARPAPWPGSEGPGMHAFVTLQDLDALDRAAKGDAGRRHRRGPGGGRGRRGAPRPRPPADLRGPGVLDLPAGARPQRRRDRRGAPALPRGGRSARRQRGRDRAGREGAVRGARLSPAPGATGVASGW